MSAQKRRARNPIGSRLLSISACDFIRVCSEPPIADATLEGRIVLASIADFMNAQRLGPIEQGVTKENGVPVMATPAVAVPASFAATITVVAFTVPAAAYVAGRVVN